MLRSKKTKPCGRCCNLALIPENESHRAGGYRVGYCWAGPIPWRATNELVHGCKTFDVVQKRWNPEKQWFWPQEKRDGGRQDGVAES